MTTTLLDTLTRLQASLDQLAGSLRAADADAVLRAEEPLASVVTAMGRLRRADVDGADGHEVRQAIAAVRTVLARCESLGRSAQSLGQAMAPDLEYGRRGLHVMAPHASRRLVPSS